MINTLNQSHYGTNGQVLMWESACAGFIFFARFIACECVNILHEMSQGFCVLLHAFRCPPPVMQLFVQGCGKLAQNVLN